MIGRLQDKIGLAAVRGPALEAFVQSGIGLYGLYAIVGAGFGLVAFAGQNDLPIPSLEVKPTVSPLMIPLV